MVLDKAGTRRLVDCEQAVREKPGAESRDACGNSMASSDDAV